jgi:hypothetical protein
MPVGTAGGIDFAEATAAANVVQPITNGVADMGRRKVAAPVLALNRFMLEQSEVAALQQEHGLSLHELMQLLVAPAALLARAPISRFPVG